MFCRGLLAQAMPGYTSSLMGVTVIKLHILALPFDTNFLCLL